MPLIHGLHGLRPTPTAAARLTSPPYDVIRPGSPLERHLAGTPDNLYHIILGTDPAGTLADLRQRGILVEDAEPCFYVYEQTWTGGRRLGVLTAVEVQDYQTGRIRRHEKVFAAKVQGRLALARTLGYTPEPVFLLAPAGLQEVLEQAMHQPALYAFTSDHGGSGDLHGLASRIVRVPEASHLGRRIAAVVGEGPLYIADGHHRYHAAVLGQQTRTQAYVTGGATILAYDRLVNGRVKFAEIIDRLDLKPAPAWATPPKHVFCLYHQGKAWHLSARSVPSDPVGRLDCSILERELYPHLGLSHDLILDPRHFDYLPERELATMKEAVDAGHFDLAIALHPVEIEDLKVVADAGLNDPEVVMPEKSTFFSPKILSGLILYQHAYKPA